MMIFPLHFYRQASVEAMRHGHLLQIADDTPFNHAQDDPIETLKQTSAPMLPHA